NTHWHFSVGVQPFISFVISWVVKGAIEIVPNGIIGGDVFLLAIFNSRPADETADIILPGTQASNPISGNSRRLLSQQPSKLMTDFFPFIFSYGDRAVFWRDNRKVSNIKPGFVLGLPVLKGVVVVQFVFPRQIFSSKLDVQPVYIRFYITFRNPMFTIPQTDT